MSRRPFAALIALLVLSAAAPAYAAEPFTLFETGQVRPLAQSPDGTRLFAINTPDNRLEVFNVGVGSLTHVVSIPVGLEPIAVAARTNTEVWVVNHLSDSVSIVDVTAPATARVVRTLLVGDEPRDIVFAGAALRSRLHHHRPPRPEHRAPPDDRERLVDRRDRARRRLGVRRREPRRDARRHAPHRHHALRRHAARAGRDAERRHGLRRGLPLRQPHHCRSTRFSDPERGRGRGGLPEPNTNFQMQAQPETGLIVKFDGADWVDELGRSWNSVVKFALPDKDVFAIDANANPPIQVAGTGGILHRRRYGPLQHGRQPVQREGLRLESRVVQRRALRGAGHFRRRLQASGRAADRARTPARRVASPCSMAPRFCRAI